MLLASLLSCNKILVKWETRGEFFSSQCPIKNQRAITLITFSSCGYEFVLINATNISSGGDLEIPFAYTLIKYKQNLGRLFQVFRRKYWCLKDSFKRSLEPNIPILLILPTLCIKWYNTSSLKKKLNCSEVKKCSLNDVQE